MASILLPPSPNWFIPDSISCNRGDNLYVAACFKNILIYHVDESESVSIKPYKAVVFNSGKVKGVKIYPFESENYKRTVAAYGDQGGLFILNCDTGIYTAEQKTKEVFNALCWAVIGGEDCLVAVGNAGLLAIWNPKDMSFKVINLGEKKNLTLIQTLPFDRTEALIVGSNHIIQVNLKTCTILRYFKGHYADIYCIEWCDGRANPLEVDLEFSRNTNAPDDSKTVSESSPAVEIQCAQTSYFASSDVNNNILVWDFGLGRYIVQLEQKNRYKAKDNQHIALLWLDNRLYSSNASGELLIWNLREKTSSSRVICHLHNRVIYNLNNIGHTIISYAQDRQICGFDVSAKKTMFEVPTIGICPRTMSFNPHDPSRLVMGFQDGCIKLINFLKQNNAKTQIVSQFSKSIILAMSWHPENEFELLFGTSEGQVGIVNVLSRKNRNFSSFHLSDVYRVDWGPPINPKKYALSTELCVYSLGGKAIFMRPSSGLLQEPVDLIKTLPHIGPSPKPTDFAFSPDSKLFSIGFNEGHIFIYDIKTEELKIKIKSVRKIIQHLNWKPSSKESPVYVLGVASGEIVVYIFDLTTLILAEESEAPVTLLQATRELAGHRSRVTWLSWSSHDDDLIATASYDRTVQVWSSKTGQPICCYGGHPNRIFRVEFSLVEPKVLLSFSEENCVHMWKIEDIKTVTTKDALVVPRPRMRSNHSPTIKEEAVLIKTTGEESSGQHRKTKTNVPQRSSYFPVFHSASSRKKSFLHACILVLRKELQVILDSPSIVSDEGNEESSTLLPEIDREKFLKEVITDYGDVLLTDTVVDAGEISTYLDLFGNAKETSAAVDREILHHLTKGNTSHCDEMHLWNDTSEAYITWCAKNNQLNSFLVSVAPSISIRFWEYACTAYSEQLVAQGEFMLAASYLLCLQKVEIAVKMLADKNLYREALAIAKVKLTDNAHLIEEISETWAQTAIREGNFELATVLYLSIGHYESAARTMSRRTEVWSLMIGQEIYDLADKQEMAEAMAAMCFKEGMRRNRMPTVEAFILSSPGFRWLHPLYLTIDYLTGAVNDFELPSVKNFDKRKLRDELLISKIKLIWIDKNVTASGNRSQKYVKYFPLDIVHFSVQDVKQMMNLWISISVAINVIVEGQPNQSEDTTSNSSYDSESWDRAVQFILEAAAATGSYAILYKVLVLLFQHGEAETENLSVVDMLGCLLNRSEINKDDGSSHQDCNLPLLTYLGYWRRLITLCELNCLHDSIVNSTNTYDQERLRALISQRTELYESHRIWTPSSNLETVSSEGTSTASDSNVKSEPKTDGKWNFNFIPDWNKMGETGDEICTFLTNLITP